MNENFQERLAELPDYLAGHLTLSISALILGIAISIPLGVLASRSERARGPVLAVASLVQTIPSIALLALMVPLLGGTIGFLPAFVALTMYSVLPVLRNTVTGISELNPAIVEAAHGVGMTDWQRLCRVELPLAAPVIVAGIRTATVWVVGTATLSTPVGAPSLGNYIFAGLQTRNWISVLFGCVFAAALAIILDQIIRRLEIAFRERRYKMAWGALAAFVFVVIGGLAPSLIKAGTRSTGNVEIRQSDTLAPQVASGPVLSGQTIVVGSKTFTEQYILSEFIEQRLVDHGATVKTIQNMGSTILFDALRNNTVDVYVDYTGTIWTTIMEQNQAIERTAMSIEVAHYLREEYNILMVASLGFQNAYCFAMRRDRMEGLGLRSIADLAEHAAELTVGGDTEFFARPEWVNVRDAYGLGAIATRGMDSTFMYQAVRDKKVDVIGAYTTDGRITAFDLVVLEDPKAAFPPYDAIILLSPKAAQNSGLVSVLSSLTNKVSDDMMREANRLVDLEGQSPKRASEFLYREFSTSSD